MWIPCVGGRGGGGGGTTLMGGQRCLPRTEEGAIASGGCVIILIVRAEEVRSSSSSYIVFATTPPLLVLIPFIIVAFLAFFVIAIYTIANIVSILCDHDVRPRGVVQPELPPGRHRGEHARSVGREGAPHRIVVVIAPSPPPAAYVDARGR